MTERMPRIRFGLGTLCVLISGAFARAESDSGLKIQQVVPQTITPGQSLPIEVIITNTTLKSLDGVIVSGQLPASYTLSKSEPECKTDGATLLWTIGSVESKESRKIKLRLAPRPGVEPDAELQFDFRATHQAVSRDQKAVKVVRPECAVAIDAPSDIIMGQPFRAKVVVRNEGSLELKGLTVRTGLVEGLSHAKGNDLECECSTLQARESETIQLDLTPTKTGEARAIVRVSGAGLAPIERELVIKVREVKVALRAVPLVRNPLGKESRCAVFIENQGDRPISRVTVMVGLPNNVEGFRGTHGPAIDSVARVVHWELTDLQPDKPIKIEWACTAQKAGQYYLPLTVQVGGVTRTRSGIFLRADHVDPEMRFLETVVLSNMGVSYAAESLACAATARASSIKNLHRAIGKNTIPEPTPDPDAKMVKPVQFTEDPKKSPDAPERLPDPKDVKDPPGPILKPAAPQPEKIERDPVLPRPKNADPKLPDVPRPPNVPTLPAPSQVPEKDEFEPENDEVLLAAARNSAKAGRLREASARFSRFLARNPNDTQVRIEYAGVLAKAGRQAEAIQQYLTALPNVPAESVKLRVALADLYVSVKEYKLAIGQLLIARNEIDRKAPGAGKVFVDVTTRLVRANLFDDCWSQALQEYDGNLKKLEPGEDSIGPLFALMLVDLDKPNEAIRAVEEMKEPASIDPLSYMALARAYSRLGEHPKALAAAQTLASKYPKELTIRRQLGETLAGTQDYELAEQIFIGIMQTNPENSETQIAYARMLIKLFRVNQGRQILAAVVPNEQTAREHSIACAEAHAANGEYTEARQIFRKLTRIWPGDYEVRFLLSKLNDSLGEYQKAKAELCKIPADSWNGRAARIRHASILVQERKIPEALKMFEALAIQYPHDSETVGEFALTLVKGGFPERAEALIRSYITNSARTKLQMHAAEASLGRILLEVGRPRDAVVAYEASIVRPGPKDPYAVFGLAQGFLRSGMAERASESFGLATSSPLTAIWARLIFSDRSFEEGEYQRAADLAGSALHSDPNNTPAMLRLAEAKQKLSQQTGEIKDAVRAADGILAGSPGNTRGLLIMARTLNIGQEYAESAKTYEHIIHSDSDIAIVKRELARTLYAGREFDRAHSAYQAAQAVPDEQFRGDLAMVARASPKAHDVITAFLVSQAPGAILAPEVRKLADSIDDPTVRQFLNSAAIDFEARMAESKGAGLEDIAKLKKDIRNWAAIPSYLDLISYEPANLEGLFDLGQVYGAQKMNHKELDIYSKTLIVDPQHREARIASARSSLELNPRLTSFGGYSRQKGFDGVTYVETRRLGSLVEIPWRDENEVVGFGFQRAWYRPFDGPVLDGNILTVTGSAKITDQYLAFGVLNYEQFESRMQDRPTFDAGWRVLGDTVKGEVAAYLENMIVNEAAIEQGIYRAGLRMSVDRQETRRWDYGGLYRFAAYSDDNFGNEVNLHSGFIVKHHPHQVRLLAAVDIIAFAESTVFGPFPPPNVRGSIHPYFSPDFYLFYRGGIEYTHFFTRDSFLRSDAGYVTANYQVGWDNSFAIYHIVTGAVNYDVKNWLTLRADARFTISDVYENSSLNATAIIRLPFGID